jgi:SET domain
LLEQVERAEAARSMPKPRKPKFSLAPVEFREHSIAGRGVFAKRRFKPGEVILPYAPKQRRLDVEDPEATLAAQSKLTLLSEQWTVIVPDTSVPGGWLCNHSCNPNSAIYSDREGRIQCTRAIAPGEEVTIFYGWVTQNEPGRDPCLCGAARCRGFINFDLSDQDAALVEDDSEAGQAVRARLAEYIAFLGSIGQEQVEETILRTLATLRTGRG